ncbi:MAG: phosphotransferase family protein [Verrucomicrobiota bacterium]
MALTSVEATELVSKHLGGNDWACTPFGAGKFSETFSVEGSGTEQYVLRIAPPDNVLQLFYEYRMMRQEPAIHRRLLSETNVPVPEIIAYDFSREYIDRDYLIMRKLPGTPLSESALNRTALQRVFREWGYYVAQIHSVTDPDNRFGYLGEHNCMTPTDTWAEAFATMYRKELNDIVGTGIYDDKTAESMMDVLNENLAVFEHCDVSRLLHGDLWVTNVLVSEEGEVTGVIDFDRACWGDIEWDLAIAEYCGVTQPAFWDGYGETIETHRGPAAIRRFFYLLYEHQKYIVIAMSSRRNDPKGAKRYAKESLDAVEKFRATGIPAF